MQRHARTIYKDLSPGTTIQIQIHNFNEYHFLSLVIHKWVLTQYLRNNAHLHDVMWGTSLFTCFEFSLAYSDRHCKQHCFSMSSAKFKYQSLGKKPDTGENRTKDRYGNFDTLLCSPKIYCWHSFFPYRDLPPAQAWTPWIALCQYRDQQWSWLRRLELRG